MVRDETVLEPRRPRVVVDIQEGYPVALMARIFPSVEEARDEMVLSAEP